MKFPINILQDGLKITITEHLVQSHPIPAMHTDLFHDDRKKMRLTISHCLVMALISIGSMSPATASDTIQCEYEKTSDFGERFEFGYDPKRNIILIQKRKNGGYKPYFTLGHVGVEGGALNFHFELWDNGSVAMRESHSLDLETYSLLSSKDYYSADGKSSKAGPQATAKCSNPALTSASTPVAPTPAKPSKIASKSKIICRSQDFHVGSIDAAGKRTGHWCTKSNLPSTKEYSYGPENLGKQSGAWCEGEDGQGIGVGVEFSIEPSAKDGSLHAFDHIMVQNGYDRTTKTFMQNSRVKQIEIRTDDGESWVRTLRDETGPQRVNLGKTIRPHGMLITILDVYPGQKYQDTSLSYLMAGLQGKT